MAIYLYVMCDSAFRARRDCLARTTTVASFRQSNAIERDCVDAMDADDRRVRQSVAEFACAALLKKLQKTLAQAGRHR
ncbi:hypothetical protein [Xanthomonas sp. GW]|uniref:hypothetical protein n=1 Tax=Xanthomonas sp. GW TaxID=2724121 RepID=UPI00163B421E|nr:hypothetical protein [Xanthomonas sp. GW]